MLTFALDTEAFFSKELSITTMGAWNYVFDSEADHYLLSVAGSDGTRFVGHSSAAPWDHIRTGDAVVCHNFSYDGLVFQRLIKDGHMPADALPNEQLDSADLAAYLGFPRSLKMAVQAMFGVPVSKDTRDKMKNKQWREMTPAFQEEVKTYALADAEWCLKIWQEHGREWPVKERRLSRLTREMAWRGIRVDVERVERGIKQMQLLCWAAENRIPWSGDGPALSYPRLVKYCQEQGIDAPASLAITDDGCAEWEDRHGAKYPVVGAMRIKRRCNAMLKKLQTIRSRVREDETIPAELKYYGAGMGGRWSGAGGINWQNLGREEMFGEKWWKEEGYPVVGDLIPTITEGIDLRACLIPKAGCRFVIPDLSQIEPRVAAVMVRDTEFLRLLGEGYSPYDAHAVSTGMCAASPVSLKKSNKPLYNLAKARELSLSYGAGHHKFLVMSKLYISDDEMDRIFSAPVTDAQIAAYEQYLAKCKSLEWNARWKAADAKMRLWLVNSWLTVCDFRQKKPKTINMWRRLGDALKSSVGDDLEVMLPSGRALRYRKVATQDGEITAVIPQFGKLVREKVYSGAIFNQCVQGTARDVFAECLLRLDDAGYAAVFHVHDEVVLQLPVGESAERVRDLMRVPPDWMPSLPVESEITESECYTK